MNPILGASQEMCHEMRQNCPSFRAAATQPARENDQDWDGRTMAVIKLPASSYQLPAPSSDRGSRTTDPGPPRIPDLFLPLVRDRLLPVRLLADVRLRVRHVGENRSPHLEDVDLSFLLVPPLPAGADPRGVRSARFPSRTPRRLQPCRIR